MDEEIKEVGEIATIEGEEDIAIKDTIKGYTIVFSKEAIVVKNDFNGNIIE